MSKSELEKDIKMALKLLYHQPLTLEERNFHNKIYPWSNENINTYYNYYDLTNKNALCITSSGDHLLYAVAAGATDIDAFDMNRLAKYYSALKIALILAYDENNFFKHFPDKLYNFISTKINLNNIKSFLCEDYLIFWEEIMNTKVFKNNILLFRFDGFPVKFNLDYNLLKESLFKANINYYDMNADEFFKYTTKTYDAIFLSNILDWGSEFNNYFLLKSYINLLNDNGVLYDYLIKRHNISPLCELPEFEKSIGLKTLVYRKK